MNRLLGVKYLILCFLTLAIAGCDLVDRLKVDPIQSESTDPPILPNLELNKPDIDFFINNSASKTAQDMTGYEMATELISTIVQPDLQHTYTFLPFLTRAEQAEPEFTNEQWEWNYNYTNEMGSFDIRLLAKNADVESDNSWMLYISNPPNQDLSLNNYRLMDLYAPSEGGWGTWVIFPFDTDSTELWLDWSMDTTNDYQEFVFNFDDQSSGLQRTVIYTREGHAHFIQIEADVPNGHDSFVIQWNTETNEGSVDEVGFGGERICWDENLQDTEC